MGSASRATRLLVLVLCALGMLVAAGTDARADVWPPPLLPGGEPLPPLPVGPGRHHHDPDSTTTTTTTTTTADQPGPLPDPAPRQGPAGSDPVPGTVAPPTSAAQPSAAPSATGGHVAAVDPPVPARGEGARAPARHTRRRPSHGTPGAPTTGAVARSSRRGAAPATRAAALRSPEGSDTVPGVTRGRSDAQEIVVLGSFVGLVALGAFLRRFRPPVI